MIKAEYIDITTLRNFFNQIEKTFTDLYLTKKNLTYGLSTGVTKTGTIEPLYAGVSQIQYLLKKSGSRVITWWTVQHILVAYIKLCIEKKNIGFYTSDIKQVLTDQGKPALPESDIILVLNTLTANYKDDLLKDIYKSPLINFKSDKPADLISDKDSESFFSRNMFKIITGGVAGLMVLSFVKNINKNKKKKR